MSAELIKNQSEQIGLLKELLSHKDDIISIYKEHLKQQQQQFDSAIKMLDEAIELNKKLSEKTTTN
jgi:hypothetical protein